MDPHDPPPDIDQQIRVNELRESAREAAGGEMTSWESEETPPEVSEQFWRNVMAFESAGSTCHFDQLVQRGVQMPAPQELDDAQLSQKLWEVIHQLAEIDVYLSSTDHLGDRELYSLLWEDLLREVTPDLPPGSGWRCRLDILGGCSEQDIYLHHMYYADEDERDRWRKDFPEDAMPDHVDPPYDRDRTLPKPDGEG